MVPYSTAFERHGEQQSICSLSYNHHITYISRLEKSCYLNYTEYTYINQDSVAFDPHNPNRKLPSQYTQRILHKPPSAQNRSNN